MRTWIPLALLLAACGSAPDDTGSPSCRDPELWYPPEPPEDDRASVYFGCNPPPGWVTDPSGAPTEPTAGTPTGTPAGSPTGTPTDSG